MDSINLGEEGFDQNTGQMPPTGAVDPNGFQSAATVSAGAGGLALMGGGDPSDTVIGFLGLGTHSSELLTAGFSWVSLGRVSLSTAGLLLIALSVILNVASLVIRWQNFFTERRILRDCYKKMRELQARSATLDRTPSGGYSADTGGVRTASTGALPPTGRVDPNG